MTPGILVIIPALNEEMSIGRVIADIPRDLVSEIVVTDNGSTDGTADVAAGAGATVLREERRGYGYACMKGIHYALSKP
ncbi:MAG: glycosyltransferase, partial [Thermodesulfobacteriota bacterium]